MKKSTPYGRKKAREQVAKANQVKHDLTLARFKEQLHDIRHSAASAMINAGVDLYTVGAVLGHKSHASTQRYSHLATDRLSEAIAKIGNAA